MAGTLTLQGMAAGLLSGQKTFGPLTIVGTTVIDETLDVLLSSGDNTIAVPTGAVCAVIVPPATNTQELKVRTNLNSGDAGLPISPASPFVFAFYTGTTSLIVNAAGSLSTFTAIWFI